MVDQLNVATKTTTTVAVGFRQAALWVGGIVVYLFGAPAERDCDMIRSSSTELWARSFSSTPAASKSPSSRSDSRSRPTFPYVIAINTRRRPPHDGRCCATHCRCAGPPVVTSTRVSSNPQDALIALVADILRR